MSRVQEALLWAHLLLKFTSLNYCCGQQYLVSWRRTNFNINIITNFYSLRYWQQQLQSFCSFFLSNTIPISYQIFNPIWVCVPIESICDFSPRIVLLSLMIINFLQHIKNNTITTWVFTPTVIWGNTVDCPSFYMAIAMSHHPCASFSMCRYHNKKLTQYYHFLPKTQFLLLINSCDQ